MRQVGRVLQFRGVPNELPAPPVCPARTPTTSRPRPMPQATPPSPTPAPPRRRRRRSTASRARSRTSRSPVRSARSCSPTSAPTSSRSTRRTTRTGTSNHIGDGLQPRQAQHRHRTSRSRSGHGRSCTGSSARPTSCTTTCGTRRRTRLGVDYESLRAINPDLIYCHTRGLRARPTRRTAGQRPDRGVPRRASTGWTAGSTTAARPLWANTSLGDTGNGLLSAIGVVQALYHRDRTGEGQFVDTSIMYAHLLNASMAWITADGSAVGRPAVARRDAARSGAPCTASTARPTIHGCA